MFNSKLCALCSDRKRIDSAYEAPYCPNCLIRVFGDPSLTQRCNEVLTFDKELRHLVSDLTSIMNNSIGVGLAAPQIGVLSRVFVWQHDDAFGHIVNPTLELSEDIQDGEEGCLSIPGLQYHLPRAMRAVARGFNEFGDPILIEGSEFLARIVQHETDHLNGILFIDRLSAEERKRALSDIRNTEWFNSNLPFTVTPRVSPHV